MEDNRTPFQKHWWKVVVGLVALIILLSVPPTRMVILWLLPLGSGIDDLIVMVAVAVIFIICFIKGWISIPGWFRRKGRKD